MKAHEMWAVLDPDGELLTDEWDGIILYKSSKDAKESLGDPDYIPVRVIVVIDM